MHIHVGFTGTQQGMTLRQKQVLTRELGKLKRAGARVFHHGDCTGADEEAAGIAKALGFQIKGHPPVLKAKRAFFKSDEEAAPLSYLDRNRVIAKECSIVLATPKEYTEQPRGSGTWATVRYTRKAKKKLTIIYPKGELEDGNPEKEGPLDKHFK